MPASQPSKTATRQALGTSRPAVILVSDDNFSARQRTWFVKVPSSHAWRSGFLDPLRARIVPLSVLEPPADAPLKKRR